jgi:hypothetical protein
MQNKLVIDQPWLEKNQQPSKNGSWVAGIALFGILLSWGLGISISDSKIAANWEKPGYSAVLINSDFQFTTEDLTPCAESAEYGCIKYKFVSKNDCVQVLSLVSTLSAKGEILESIPVSSGKVSKGVPFELDFNMTAKSEQADDTSLVELKCFRSAS